jgi:flavin reductase (DIM6/NTAB) family NADH-FMN oxidoreductase RutF
MSDAPIFDDRTFRDTLSHFASGLTVVAGLTSDGLPAGFTCQSFYSVSITPPLVSFSVGVSSTTYPVIRAAGRFVINVLAGEQCELASQFARSGTDKWAGVKWSPSPNGNPVIQDSLMWLDCELHAEYPAGDHLIVVARVLRMSPPEWHTREPLLFFKGRFHHLLPTRGSVSGEPGRGGFPAADGLVLVARLY